MSTVRYTGAKVLYQGIFQPLDLWVKSGQIKRIAPADVPHQPDERICSDYQGYFLLPGLLDVHCHGGKGIDINSATQADYTTLSEFFASHGVTGFLASILTDTQAQTEACIREVVKALQEPLPGASLLGIHLEGPFLNELFKGAMPAHLLRSGDLALIERYQQLAGGAIRYLTLAPEVGQNMALIPALRELGIVVALGHSNATCAQTRQAIDAGAQAVTHLMNAMRPIHQHEIGIAGATLLDDRVYAETICDGLHLKPETVALIEHNKGLQKMLAITDCIMATGLPDGEYHLGVNAVVVEAGDAKLKDSGVRAGSTLTLDRALRNLCQFTGHALEKAVQALTANQADLFGWADRGYLMPGRRADFVVMDESLEVVATYVEGRCCYTRMGQPSTV